MIRVDGLTKDYGSRRAVDNISFHAEKGEILGFLGPNGAGKTTTMRVLTGYMPPSSGKAAIAGFDVVEQSLEVRRRVGYVPETVPLYPDMTVRDYLKFMADLRRVPKADDRVDEVMVLVNIEDRARGYIGNLSKGLKQRVGLAQALIHQPDVLILDEPTIGLDPAQIIEVRNLIRDLGKERTVMLSTHILSEAQQVCDRVLIINKGKIVAEDTPERLQARLAGVQKVLVKVLEILPGQDIRPHLARAVITANFDLLELRQVSLSLEDIFIELTREEPEPPSISEDTAPVDEATSESKEEYPEE
jgi:ABC-2 type transport system ATP-binding protein